MNNVPKNPERPHTRVALVGCGAICSTHLEILSSIPGVEVVALVDARIEAAETLAHLHGVPLVSTTIATLVDHDVHVAHLVDFIENSKRGVCR